MEARTRAHDEIHQRHQQIDLGAEVGLHHQVASLEHDLRRRNGGDDRGVLEQGDAVVRRRRHDHVERLGKNDLTHGRQRRHADGQRGLHLPGVDRLDPGAEDLQPGRRRR